MRCVFVIEGEYFPGISGRGQAGEHGPGSPGRYHARWVADIALGQRRAKITQRPGEMRLIEQHQRVDPGQCRVHRAHAGRRPESAEQPSAGEHRHGREDQRRLRRVRGPRAKLGATPQASDMQRRCPRAATNRAQCVGDTSEGLDSSCVAALGPGKAGVSQELRKLDGLVECAVDQQPPVHHVPGTGGCGSLAGETAGLASQRPDRHVDAGRLAQPGRHADLGWPARLLHQRREPALPRERLPAAMYRPGRTGRTRRPRS